MDRYQILIVDADIVDLVHEITVRTLVAVKGASGREASSDEVYTDVFDACRDVLKKYVRGFHVCGCMDHCAEGVEPTRYSVDSPVGAQVEALGRSRRVCRYVLSLEVPLPEFMKELGAAVLQALAQHAEWRDVPGGFPATVRRVVEEGLGRHIYYNPGCNRGEYVCRVGECTEFDPWETMAAEGRKR